KKAVQIVDSMEKLPKVLVIELEGCHESILGIIAGRIKEHYSRPAIVATKNPDGYKASARSTEYYNIFEELKKAADLLVKYGGHPMAAGLTIKEGCFEEFVRRLNDNCELEEEDMYKKILLDAEVSFNTFDEKTVNELNLFAPFGQGNPAPLFGERNLQVRSISYIGRDNSFLKFILVNSRGRQITATLFSNVSNVLDEMESRFGKEELQKAFNGAANEITITAAYVPKLNVYHDNRDIQMNLKYIRV
ncbi:MAG: single-stranded-DNA-specific exonuclease RecJ, partial [Lachnospiraceae bacterium]|nr:single-stranded-DNA-specific exonuclease RecJ [Lachnospiraceae bacterium]